MQDIREDGKNWRPEQPFPSYLCLTQCHKADLPTPTLYGMLI